MPTQEQHNELNIARINFRLPSDIKETVERAAVLCGQSLTDFAIQTLVAKANEVLEHHQVRTLSDRDRDLFLALLDSDEGPNDALKGAFEAHQRLINP